MGIREDTPRLSRIIRRIANLPLALKPKVSMPMAIMVLGLFSLSLFTFANNNLYTVIFEVSDLFLGSKGIHVKSEMLVMPMILAVYVLGPTSRGRLELLMYISWILYMPSVLKFSRIDWLVIANWPVNMSIFSKTLSPSIVLIIGLLLALGDLIFRSFKHMDQIRANMLERGADQSELNLAMRKNSYLTAEVAAASAGITSMVVISVPLIESAFTIGVQGMGFPQIILGISAILTLGTTIAIYLRTLINR